jgi:hypothetical protein
MAFHLKTFLRTDFTAIITLYASGALNNPGGIHFFNIDCSCGAPPGTHAAKDTVINRNCYSSSGTLKLFLLFYGIDYRVRSMKKIFKKRFTHA